MSRHLLALALAPLTLVACGAAAVAPRPGMDAVPGATDAGPPEPHNPDRGGIVLPDAATGAEVDMAVVQPEPCAEEKHAAVRVPLDVFFLLDASNSMNDPAGNRTKYQVVRGALNAFFADPRSAGLGVGLTFFPSVKTCQKNADCPADGLAPGRCVVTPDGACISGASTIGLGCGAGAPACPAGSTCKQVGACPNGFAPGQTSNSCVIGTMCAGNEPCRPIRNVCFGMRADCTGSHYARPGVDFAELPGAVPELSAVMADRDPYGGTPLPDALAGTLSALRARQAAHPDRKLALVIGSDGMPDATCGGVPGVLAALAAARAGAAGLATYAIGVFAGREAADGRALMTDVARAGGTDRPYVLDPDVNLAGSFLEALNAIRGAALPCEFLIPPERKGAIDFGRVNVRWRSGAGDQILGYVDDAVRCTPDKGGWHYDADPRTGGAPTRVVLCPSTCQAVKAAAAATVELRFGCRTRLIE
jgi:hypothetical protein